MIRTVDKSDTTTIQATEKKNKKFIYSGDDLFNSDDKNLPHEVVEEQFFAEKIRNGTRPATLDGYRSTIKYFYNLPNAVFATNEAEILRSWIDGRINDFTPSPARRNRLVAYMRHFWTIANDNFGIFPQNPAKGIKKITEEIKTRIISLEEIAKIKENLINRIKEGNTKFEDIRNYAIFLVQLETGIRPGELLRIRREHINFNIINHSTVAFITLTSNMTKNKKARQVAISQASATYVKKYVKWHSQLFTDDNTPLFCSKSGMQYTTNAWGKQLKKIAGVLPYHLRHTFATTLARQDVGFPLICESMGNSPAMAQRYIHLAEADQLRIAQKSPLSLINSAPQAKKKTTTAIPQNLQNPR